MWRRRGRWRHSIGWPAGRPACCARAVSYWRSRGSLHWRNSRRPSPFCLDWACRVPRFCRPVTVVSYLRQRLSVSSWEDPAERSEQVLSAVGVGWPDGGTALAAGVPGLGWPQLRLVLVSSESSEQVPIERGAKDISVDGPEDPRLPGSDRVRNALAAAVSRGTTDAVMTAGAVDGALSSDGEQMPTQP